MLFTFKTNPLQKMELSLKGGFISKSFIKSHLSPEGSFYCSEHNPVLWRFRLLVRKFNTQQLDWILWFLGNIGFEDVQLSTMAESVLAELWLDIYCCRQLIQQELVRVSVHAVMFHLNLLLCWSDLRCWYVINNSTKTWTKDNKKELFPLNS